MIPLASSSRRGFTLVELSIVLVIIGLIIGGVLTGQQIIQNARVTNAVNGIQAFHAQFQTYMQNYSAIPGDDAAAKTRFSTNVPDAGNGNGTLEGAMDANCTSGTPTDESCFVWADLRAAGLVKNQTPVSAQPANPFGGIYGFQNGAFGVFTSTVLCLNNVPGAAAQAIDSRSDDGDPSKGDYIAAESLTATQPATAFDTTKTYTLCTKI